MEGSYRSSRKIKVAFFTHYTEMYGANRSLFEMIKSLKNCNVDAIVITPKYGDLNKLLDENNIVNKSSRFYGWVRNNFNSYTKRVCKRAIFNIINYFAVRNISKWLEKTNIDIIHTNSSVIDIGAKVAKCLSKKHIWHVREYGKEDYNIEFNVPFCKAVQFMENNSDKIVFISNDLLLKYKKYIKDQKSYEVIYNGVDQEKYTQILDNKKFFTEKIKIILCGLIHENKNQLEVLRAVSLLEEKYLKQIELHIVGSGDEAYIKILKEYISEKGLEAYVKFHGYVKNVTKLNADSQVAIVPSKKEAFGRVTVEYMLSGLAVIVSDSGANTEIVTDGKDGFVYKLGDIEDLKNKIISLIMDRNLLYTLSVKGQSTVSGYFTSDINAKKIRKLYDNILNR